MSPMGYTISGGGGRGIGRDSPGPGGLTRSPLISESSLFSVHDRSLMSLDESTPAGTLRSRTGRLMLQDSEGEDLEDSSSLLLHGITREGSIYGDGGASVHDGSAVVAAEKRPRGRPRIRDPGGTSSLTRGRKRKLQDGNSLLMESDLGVSTADDSGMADLSRSSLLGDLSVDNSLVGLDTSKSLAEDKPKRRKPVQTREQRLALYELKQEAKETWLSNMTMGQRAKKEGLRFFSRFIGNYMMEHKQTSVKQLCRALHEKVEEALEKENIRRRVYDTINVLQALGYLSKERVRRDLRPMATPSPAAARHELVWLGLPMLRTEYDEMVAKLAEQRRIELECQERVRDLCATVKAMRLLIERHPPMSQEGEPNPNIVKAPFTVFSVSSTAAVYVSVAPNDTFIEATFSEPPVVLGELDTYQILSRDDELLQ